MQFIKSHYRPSRHAALSAVDEEHLRLGADGLNSSDECRMVWQSSDMLKSVTVVVLVVRATGQLLDDHVQHQIPVNHNDRNVTVIQDIFGCRSAVEPVRQCCQSN